MKFKDSSDNDAASIERLSVADSDQRFVYDGGNVVLILDGLASN